MTWSVQLAKELQNRNNPNKIGAIVGTVINPATLKISILDGKIVLDKTQLYICNNLATYEFKNDDNVLLIPTDSEQIYFIIDKVAKVGG